MEKMNKYRLKKWYPSLPYTYKEALAGNREVIVYLDRNKYYRKGNYNKCINFEKSEIENNPEFWEKIEEKDYEILSYNKCRCDAGGKWLEDQPIHSVKRLSDGEVFTVGDKIKDRNLKVSRTITAFRLNKSNTISIYGEHENGTCFYPLPVLEKVKEPLFTTHDGVDIYEGDQCFAIFKKDFTFESLTPTKYNGRSNYLLYFSTREKAQEYIDYNKPQYSKKDIIELLDKSEYAGRCKVIYKYDFLKELEK